MIVVNDERTRVAWGVWWTAPHTPMHLGDLHDTKKSALLQAKSLLKKGWGDHFMVRKVTLGPATHLRLP